jgi:ketol-acid reductoisomerase
LEEVRNGAFAREWKQEHAAGGRRFRQLHDADRGTEYEQAGEFVRSLMPWLSSPAGSSPGGEQ